MTRSDLSFCVFIPAYNAEQTLSGVISRIPESDWKLIRQLTVVDDGSTDGTATLVATLAKENPKIALFSLPHNAGYGTAVKKGIELSRLVNPDFCACLHADGQYPSEHLGNFARFMNENSIDILQGSRHKGGTALRGNMPFYKYVFGKLLVLLENRVFGLRMTDYHSGYLFYSRRALKMLPFENFSSSFDFDMEVIASARARNLVIDELPIETHYGDEKSHLNPITYGLKVLSVLMRYAMGAYDPQ